MDPDLINQIMEDWKLKAQEENELRTVWITQKMEEEVEQLNKKL